MKKGCHLSLKQPRIIHRIPPPYWKWAEENLSQYSTLARAFCWSLFSEPLFCCAKPSNTPSGAVLTGTGPASTEPASNAPPENPARKWQPSWDSESQDIIANINSHPATLNAMLKGKDHRLGIRFETLWHYFFIKHSRYKLLAYNEQILTTEPQPRTLGAVDFLLFDRHIRQSIHLEIAVKFYGFYKDVPAVTSTAANYKHHDHNQNQSQSHQEQWIGPNPRDSLARKVSHLTNQQLQLTCHADTQKHFYNKGLPLPDLHIGIIKGYLFQAESGKVPLPAGINANANMGIWRYSTRNSTHETPQNTVRLSKHQWLDPAPKIEDQHENHEPKHQHKDSAIMLITEKNREFLMPATWPDFKERR